MSYRDPARQREFQRSWIAKRKSDWIQANGPCKFCGSTERLEVDHIDPDFKVTHRIWSWSEARRAVELAKCRVLCHDCNQGRRAAQHGGVSMYQNGCRCEMCVKAYRDYRRFYVRQYRLRQRRTEVAA